MQPVYDLILLVYDLMQVVYDLILLVYDLIQRVYDLIQHRVFCQKRCLFVFFIQKSTHFYVKI